MSSLAFAPVDVNCLIGSYPFREVPHPDPEVLVRVLDREGIASAWVGSLPSAFHRDPTPANRTLVRALEPYRSRLFPVPTIRPDWPGWRQDLQAAVGTGAPAIRAYPAIWALGAGHLAMSQLAFACGEVGVPLLLTVRFEDLRQRHHLDTAGDLTAAAVRAVARLSGSRCHLIVLGAGRELIEEIHWGLTVSEQNRVWYDFGWLWGPPEDHFAHLLRTLGGNRFVFGSAWPLRLTQQSRSLVELLPDDALAMLQSNPLASGADILAAAQKAAAASHGQVEESFNSGV